DRAALDLENTTIRAPIGGRVGLRNVDKGSYLRVGDQTVITTINQLQPIHILFSLPADMIGVVAEALAAGPVQVTAIARDMKTPIETGVLSTIDGQIDPKTGTFKLKATFENQHSRLWPGQFINARLLLATRMNVIVVPEQAVQRGPDGA